MLHTKLMPEITPPASLSAAQPFGFMAPANSAGRPNYILPSYDFIAGLLTCTGSFLWVKQKNSEVPVFQLKMQAGDYDLLELIKAKLEIKESIHQYIHQGRQYSLLLIRSRRTIETVLIPVLDGRLFGEKKIQFDLWKKKYFEKRLEFVYKKHS